MIGGEPHTLVNDVQEQRHRASGNLDTTTGKTPGLKPVNFLQG
jgi:hypothetical protein